MLEKQWKEYSQRFGLKTSLEILVGLSKEHEGTQLVLGNFQHGNLSLVQVCHWLESTSDLSSGRISLQGLGLLAETLLDLLADAPTVVSRKIKNIRKKTRERKKEIAMERRSKAIMGMSKFGPLAGSSFAVSKPPTSAPGESSSSVRGTAASLLAPVFGFFRDPSTNAAGTEAAESSQPSSKRRKKSPAPKKEAAKPAWMEEMENMEDETGLTCAVCQEGTKNQPTNVLGLYAYIKKVILSSPTGNRLCIDGTNLLMSLSSLDELPATVQGTHAGLEWYPNGRAAGEQLSRVPPKRTRESSYVTTVSAGNAIHINCHAKARQADRNHPKAPKSEWEGASLRNSRVNCNVILPLVSSRSSQAPLCSVEQALTDHQTAIANLIGVRPKTNLWTVLHDVRFLLLRMSYGEALNADCGGGSLASNSQLIFYQLSMASMFENEAQVDSPTSSLHARALSSGFLAACEIASAEDYQSSGASTLVRDIADSSVMAALTCILFHNTKDDNGASDSSSCDAPHPKRRWLIGKELFLRGLLNCAGCRHASGIHDSGCISGRTAGSKRSRSTAFVDWEMVDDAEGASAAAERPSRAGTRKFSNNNSSRATIDDFANALRPFVVYYAIMDQLSADFSPSLDDQAIEEAANRLVEVIEECQRSKGIHELLEKAHVTLSHSDILKELQRGMVAA